MKNNVAQSIVLNIAAIITGIIVLFAVNFVATLVFGLLLQIPILVKLLSWPSTPVLYIMSVSNVGALIAACSVCDHICPATENGRKPGAILFSVIALAIFVLLTFSAFRLYGVSDQLFANGLCVLAAAGFCVASIKNE